MKILLTGGLGFIGTALIQRKSENQFIVCSENEKSHLEDYKNIIFEFGKIETDSFCDLVKKYKPDLIIHMASITGLKYCEENSSKAFTTNVYGTFNVIKACMLNKVRLMFLSSREVYGATFNEVDESHPLKPTNVYGITKQLAENMIVSEHKKSNLVYTILRLSNVYGPGSTKGVNRMIQSAVIDKKIFLNGGNQYVNLIYIDDLIEIISNLLNNKHAFNQIFNVGSFDNISVKEFAKIISTKYEKNLEIIQKESLKFENKNFKPNLNKLLNIVDFSPKVHVEEGIKKTINWYEENFNESKN